MNDPFRPPLAANHEAAAPAPALTWKDLPQNAAGTPGDRFVGRLVDLVVWSGTAIVAGAWARSLLALLEQSDLVRSGWSMRIEQLGASWFAAAGLGVLSSIAVTDGLGGASLGKRLYRLRIVAMSDLQVCGPFAASVRTLGMIPDLLRGGHGRWKDGVLNQSLGDTWADTAVVRADALPAGSRRTPANVPWMTALGIAVQFVVHGVGTLMLAW